MARKFEKQKALLKRMQREYPEPQRPEAIEVRSFADQMQVDPQLRREFEACWQRVDELAARYKAAHDPDPLTRAFLEVFSGESFVLLDNSLPS